MKCLVCAKRMVGKYYVDTWGHAICEVHLNNDIVHCHSCNSFTTKEIALPDGRILCVVCNNHVVKNGDTIDFLVSNVVNALSKVGFDDLRQGDITIEIVTPERMAQLRQGATNLQNKGLVQSKVMQTYSVFSGKKHKFKHVIYILTHLTKNEFSGVLAHEMLHAWQVQNEIHMPAKDTEGLCNLGSYLMYIALAGSINKMHIKQLESNPDSIYGDGFCEMFARLEDFGWSELIKRIREG